MKFKLDQNLSQAFVPLFVLAGHEADTARSEGLSRASDMTIYDVCRAEGRCLVTLDVDFAIPALFPPGPTEGIILLRLGRRQNRDLIARLITQVLNELGARPIRGRLWSVRQGRVRIYTPSGNGLNPDLA
jgi:predicted nuclease of predicted toxin-antitoxin system